MNKERQPKMKTLILSAFMLLALQSSAQKDTGIFNKIIQKPFVMYGTSILIDSGIGFINPVYSANKVYDTIRVLITYADTVKDSYIGRKFDSRKYPINENLKWAFAFKVGRIYGDYIEYSGFLGCPRYTTPYFHRIKYITKDKKDIPKSWVLFQEVPNP